MVELQRFIQRALLDIVQGVQDAQNAVDAPCAIISPIDDNYEPRLEPIAFDIEVSTEEKSDGKEGFGICVGTAGVGVQSQRGTPTIAAGWIRFKVHVRMPVQEPDKPIAEKFRQRFERLALEACVLVLAASVTGRLASSLAP